MSPELSFGTPSAPDPTLRRLFGALVERAFLQTLGVYESHIADYLADVLTDFAHMQQVYKIKDLGGKTLHEVADMLLHADVRLEATSFNREREVHKHIGDFTLFWAGIYPEALPRLQAQTRCDHLLDYVQQGKTATPSPPRTTTATTAIRPPPCGSSPTSSSCACTACIPSASRLTPWARPAAWHRPHNRSPQRQESEPVGANLVFALLFRVRPYLPIRRPP